LYLQATADQKEVLVKFYRIETADGGGPYQGTGLQGLSSSQQHPGPYNDGLDDRDVFAEPMRFGFSSLEQALTWFTDDLLDYLSRETGWKSWSDVTGFALSVYEVDEKKVRRGGRQAVAPVATMEPVERISLTDLKNMRKGGPEWTTNDRPSMTSPSISNEQESSEPRRRSEKPSTAPWEPTVKSPTLAQLSRGVLTGSIFDLSPSVSFESWTTDLTASPTTDEFRCDSVSTTTDSRTISAID